jgi:hypothetical protein
VRNLYFKVNLLYTKNRTQKSFEERGERREERGERTDWTNKTK